MEDKKITTPEGSVLEQYRQSVMPQTEADEIVNEILILLSKKNLSSGLVKTILDLAISTVDNNSILKM